MSSEIEKDAKPLGKKIKKTLNKIGPEYDQTGTLGDYGIDYFDDTAARARALHIDTKAKALKDIRQIYANNEVGPTQAHLEVSEKDIEAYQAFEALEYLRDFDVFAADKFLKDADPAQVKWFYDIYPDIFQRRIEEIDKVLAVQKRVAILNVMGPRSKEDLHFLYELNLLGQKNKARMDSILNQPVSIGVGRGVGKNQRVRGWLNNTIMHANFPQTKFTSPTFASGYEGGNFAKLLGADTFVTYGR